MIIYWIILTQQKQNRFNQFQVVNQYSRYTFLLS